MRVGLREELAERKGAGGDGKSGHLCVCRSFQRVRSVFLYGLLELYTVNRQQSALYYLSYMESAGWGVGCMQGMSRRR